MMVPHTPCIWHLDLILYKMVEENLGCKTSLDRGCPSMGHNLMTFDRILTLIEEDLFDGKLPSMVDNL